MDNISNTEYLMKHNRIKKQIEKDVIQSFKSNKVKQKASLLNMAMPQYVRLIMLAKVLNIHDYESLSLNDLASAIRDAIGFGTQIIASITLIVIDEIQYYLLKSLVKTAPAALGKQMVKLLRMTAELLKMRVTDDQILEAFYVSSMTQIRSFQKAEYNFNKISETEKLKHVNNVIAHGIAMSYAMEASSIVANKIGIYKNLSTMRNVVLTVKYLQYMKTNGDNNVLAGGKFISILADNLKNAIMRIIGLLRSEKLRYLFRFILEIVIGPLTLVSLSNTYDDASQVAQKL